MKAVGARRGACRLTAALVAALRPASAAAQHPGGESYGAADRLSGDARWEVGATLSVMSPRGHFGAAVLVPGSIVEDGLGGTQLSPIASDVDFVLFQLGLVFQV